MSYKCISISIVMSVLLGLVSVSFAANGMDPDRYERIVRRMVDAINAADYTAVRRDFGEVMLNAFPLEVSKQFFDDLRAQYGRIRRLDSPQFVPPEQAVFPAHCDKGILDIRVVLDRRDKIVGLWFMPRAPGADDKGEDPNAGFDPNDPNAVARREWLEKVKQIIEEIDRRSEEELRGWMGSRGDRRVERARQVYNQVENEFDVLRQVADDEGAVKTVELIDILIKAREKRLEEIRQKIDDERKKERLRERERDRDARRREAEERRRERSSERSSRRSTRDRDRD